MGDILEVLKTRKSIRRYKPDPIPDEILGRVLEAARWAPTGENYQPWRLIVIKSPETNIPELCTLSKCLRGPRQWLLIP